MNTIQKGDFLESRIYDLFVTEIAADRFWAKQSCCKIFRKKGYFSKDRGAEIVFDISVEIYLPNAAEYSSLILIECKNYSHAVPVDDAEEFFAKIQQIGTAKGIIASTAAFQTGTRSYAKSKRIGLLRYFDPSEFKWELYRSPSASAKSTSLEQTSLAEEGLSINEFRSTAFDLYLQSPKRSTNSVWDFFDDLISESTEDDGYLQVVNLRSNLESHVPYLKQDSIEDLSGHILESIGYKRGEVSLDAICALEKRRSGLNINLNVELPASHLKREILGVLTFKPLEIIVFRQPFPNRGRDRFTLAHELSHHLLGHGKFLFRDSCEELDFDSSLLGSVEGTDIVRLEFQANFLASCLLMPRFCLADDFRLLLKTLGIANKGFGELYLDDQPCNRQVYEIVTSELMQRYGVSRSALTIRLINLGLLHDARATSFRSFSLG